MPGGSGGGFDGLKNSFRRSVKLPKLPPQSTSKRLLIGVLGVAGEEKKNLRFSETPEPKLVCVNGMPFRSTIFIGRSRRNCLRLDQKSSGMRCAGLPKLGMAPAGVGIISVGRGLFGRFSSSGIRLMKPGTLYPL